MCIESYPSFELNDNFFACSEAMATVLPQSRMSDAVLKVDALEAF